MPHMAGLLLTLDLVRGLSAVDCQGKDQHVAVL